MTENARPPAKEKQVAKNKSQLSPKSVIVLLVFAVFLVLIALKTVMGDTSPAGTKTSEGTTGATTITSVHNDATADYEAALKTGKPVYVLFHSLTCVPCVEISAVVDRVMPEYDDKIVFVNAISDDASARQLAARFRFQYIPTSFFLAPDGSVQDSFTGAMDETQLRAYLDALAETK